MFGGANSNRLCVVLVLVNICLMGLLLHNNLVVQQQPVDNRKLTECLVEKKRSMLELGTESKTDKVLHHGYHRFYPYFLEHLRDEHIKMFEIGYLLGDSYRMWKKYFPKGEVYVMDKDGHQDVENFFKGDQSSKIDLKKFLTTYNLNGDLDMIIDDGSHHPSHQISSFKYLFRWGLKPGGVYIIEDIEMNYWLRGETYGADVAYGRNSPNSLITGLKSLVDVVNREFAPANAPFRGMFGKSIDDNISSIFFAGNCVVIVKMSTQERAAYFKRPYRHADKVTVGNATSPVPAQPYNIFSDANE